MASTAAAVSAQGQPKVDLAKFGMITFLASEAMLFAGLIGAYIVLWKSHGAQFKPEYVEHNWPWKITTFNTVLLVSSSFTLLFAERAVLKGRSAMGAMILWLVVTVALGATFVGIQAYEWTNLKVHEHLWFNETGPGNGGTTYSSCFFTLTGFHGLHVFIGVVMLAITTLFAMGGRFTPHRHTLLNCASLYWHFVDVVWILLFTIVYLLPYWV